MLITTSQTWDKTYEEAAWVRRHRATHNKYNLLKGSCVFAACHQAHVGPRRNDTEGPNINNLIYPEPTSASLKIKACRSFLKLVQTYLHCHLESEAHNYN